MAKINFVQKGPSGAIQYIEGVFKKNICEFYFELGGRDTVATIWFPAEDAKWDEKYPWAAGRRMEVVKDMAEQARRKQAPKSTIKWETDRFHLTQA